MGTTRSFHSKGDLLVITSITCSTAFCIFYKLKVCGDPASSKSISVSFPTAICSLHVSVSRFGNSHNITNFFIVITCFIVISDLWCYYYNGLGMPQTAHLQWWTLSINAACVLTAPPLSCSSISRPPLRPAYFLRHNNKEIRPIINPTMASKCLSERNRRKSLTKSKPRNDQT